MEDRGISQTWLARKLDITEEEFNTRMDNYKSRLTQQFAESRRLEEEIMKPLNASKFNVNVGK